jgi:trimethylamine--corrinoid protein Co-methyltransferase
MNGMLKGFLRRIKPLQLMTEPEVQRVHLGVMEVLENTGVNFLHDATLELLKEKGCSVDFRSKRVKIPGQIVEESIQNTPFSFTMKARDPKHDLRIGESRLYFLAGAGLRIVDLDSWEVRPATMKELDDASIVSDALESVHMVADTAPYTDIVGVPPAMTSLVDIASHLRNTTKITITDNGNDLELFHIKMARTVGVDVLAFIGSSAPLTYDENSCKAIFRYTEAGYPFFLISSDMMGGTGPATIAGSLVSTLAEILAGIVLIQLLRKGTGVIAGDYTMPMDMRTGHPCFCDLASALHTAAFNQVMQKYRIPAFANCPGMSSAKVIDVQSGYERSMSTLNAALSGANLIVLHGSVYGEYTYHPVCAVLDDDIATWVGRLIEGFEVNDETLALDLIEKVGPIPGSYLDKKHTRIWWKSQQFIPKTADRTTYPEWIETGKKTALDYAKERTEQILRHHKVPPLDEDTDRALDEILKEAEAHYRSMGLLK